MKIYNKLLSALGALTISLLAAPLLADPSLGLAQDIVSSKATSGSFALVSQTELSPLWYDNQDFEGVKRALGDLQKDIERVSSRTPLLTGEQPRGKLAVIVGTLGRNAVIDKLVSEKKISVADLQGKWESFVITTLANPMPGIEQALVIVGSDKRGTIYGIYEISEQIGLSPWYWWADVPPKKRDQAHVRKGRYASGEPAVRYRGIFLNNERPTLTNWAQEKFGGLNADFYTKVFELLLRLRANYLWPAMWGNAFNEDDVNNPRLANEYGIVMGTSHHEPMMRAHNEWVKRKDQYGNGKWNYNTNSEALKVFFREGIANSKNYENLVTVGMRGDGDEGMVSAGSMESDIKLLEKIFTDQRQIIAEETKSDPAKTPQLWALFTEVQKYYEHGLRPPEDVTLLWTDDNIGNLRHLPTEEERKRSGGSGIYYHFDMHGGPFAYRWVNTNPFTKIWEQMNLAVEYDAKRIWIVNVGDLKPLELPIEFFLRMAWDPKAINKDSISAYTKRLAERDFGPENAAEIAEVISRYTKYNGWRKPELIEPSTFSVVNYAEADRVEAAWEEVIQKAEKISARLPKDQQAAFYQLVLHPAKASATVAQMNIAAGKNQLYARQGRLHGTTSQAARVRDLFKRDQAMTEYHNKTLSGGKWNHLMSQPHLGQFDWQPPRVDSMPLISEVLPAETANFGVAIEGDVNAWPEHYGDAVLPTFESFYPRRSYIEIFAEGVLPYEYQIKTTAPWIILNKDAAYAPDHRYWVDIDWRKAPEGKSTAIIEVTGNRQKVKVNVPIVKATKEQERQARGRFASLDGPIAINAVDAVINKAVKGVSWQAIPDYGRDAFALEVFPVTAASILPPNPAPQLEYPIYLPRSGDYEVTLILGSVMDVVPDRGMRIATAMNNDAFRVLDIFENRQAETFLGDGWWHGYTKDNARYLRTSYSVETAGAHVLKVAMVDPAIAIQKIIISDKPVPKSYFGPEPRSRLSN
ncbi:MAG TPA: glycosyl hydrolase 115 family protein [Cellvibrio sp.]|nr:glycosyl hydrolase 115 family protein [Cellvibrio sp.]